MEEVEEMWAYLRMKRLKRSGMEEYPAEGDASNTLEGSYEHDLRIHGDLYIR